MCVHYRELINALPEEMVNPRRLVITGVSLDSPEAFAFSHSSVDSDADITSI